MTPKEQALDFEAAKKARQAAEKKLVKKIARKIWSRLDLIGSSGQDAEHTVRRVLEEAGFFPKP